MSFENLFSILPDGLVSKNRIEVEITPLNIVLCNFCEARIQIAKKLTDLKKIEEIIRFRKYVLSFKLCEFD